GPPKPEPRSMTRSRKKLSATARLLKVVKSMPGPPKPEPSSLTRSRKKTLGDRQAFKGRLEKFDAVGGDGEFHRLEAEPAGEAGQLIVDQANHQIAAVAEIERRGCAIGVALPAAIR